MPVKSRFTRDQLVSTALDLIDRHGLRAFSMRSLASKLGTGPMTIYSYVGDRDELDALIVDAVLAEVRWPKTRGRWQNDVRSIAEALWLVVRAHPNVIPLILTRRSQLERNLEPGEALLHALSRSGRSAEQLLIAYRTVLGYVYGLAQTRLAGTLSPDHESLPPARFPRLVEIRKIAARIDPDYQFRSGLNIVLAGLAAPSKRSGRSARMRPGAKSL